MAAVSDRWNGKAARAVCAMAGLCALIAGPAGAADLDGGGTGLSESDRFAPVQVSEPAWSGFHIGLLLGHSWGEASALGGGISGSTDVDGVEGGIYGGYDRQVGPYVFGVEGDIVVSDASGSVPGVTLDQAWSGSLRARAGIALDQFLLYGTGGVAAAGMEATGGGLSDRATLWGWTVGAGAERMLRDNITARFEYRYSDYEGEAFALGGGGTDVESDNHSVRAGVGVRF